MNKEQFELKAKQLFDERAYQAVWAGDLVIGENSFECLIEELYEALTITDVIVPKGTLCQTPKECETSYYYQIGDYYCKKCEKTGLA